MNELALREEGQLTVADVKAQVNLIQKVMQGVMKKGTHYGTIPGCGDKPTLLKPGAEKIMSTFRLVPEIKEEDLSVPDERRYRITVRLLNYQESFVGSGIGECSSDEDKYKWRKAICNEEFEATPEDRRREKWSRGYQNKPNYKAKQIRTNIADVANTVLKMAKKRALVDAVLTATAASDIFTQDIEDMPAEILNGNKPASKPDVKPPQSKAKATNGDTETRGKLRKLILDMCGDTPDKANDTLEDYTRFTTDEGEAKAVRNIEHLKGKWLQSTYGKAKKAWEEAGFGVRPEDMEDGS